MQTKRVCSRHPFRLNCTAPENRRREEMSAAAGAGASSASLYTSITHTNEMNIVYVNYAKEYYKYILQSLAPRERTMNIVSDDLYPDGLTRDTAESALAEKIAIAQHAIKFDGKEVEKWDANAFATLPIQPTILSEGNVSGTMNALYKMKDVIYFNNKLLTIQDATNKITYTLPAEASDTIIWKINQSKIICSTYHFILIISKPKELDRYIIEFSYIYRNPEKPEDKSELPLYKAYLSNELAAALFIIANVMRTTSSASGGRRRYRKHKRSTRKHRTHKRKTHRRHRR
jgi:hypothetical protein